MPVEPNKYSRLDWSKEYGDGQEWRRGPMLGKGMYASVFLASRKNLNNNDEKLFKFPPQMAVKSAELSNSDSLKKEKTIFRDIGDCPHIITCYGSETTIGGKGETYNLLLEYGLGKTLIDRINKFGCGLPESEAKSYALSILKGLRHIHRSEYVHCDLKLDNIILVANQGRGFTAKIADFGLALKAEEVKAMNEKIARAKREGINRKKILKSFWRGTFGYMSPETAIYGIQHPRCEVWSFGCIVLEMLTGKPAWTKKTDYIALDAIEVVKRIRTEGELPEIPNDISDEAKSFLKLCLVRNPHHRRSVSSLLRHSFFAGIEL